MAHEVETMAYTNEVPWHGLGAYVAKAPTVPAMLKLAKLDWRVERRPMYWTSEEFSAAVHDKPTKTTITQDRHVKDFAALVRTSDGSVLDVVGSRYAPRQNEEVFEFFKEFVEAGKATMETAGSLRGGKIVWGLANLNASFTLKNNDKVKGYLLALNYHQQGKSNLYKFTAVRVVCANTLALGLADAGGVFKDYHSTKFTADTITRAKEALGIAREQLSEFEKNARLLQKLNLSRADVIKILAPIYQPEYLDTVKANTVESMLATVGNPQLKRVMDVYVKAPGAQPGNGWGALNAVTYYSDHVASRTADKRLTNAWTGKTAAHKEKVLDSLMALT